MKPAVTQWFDPDQVPSRPGVYEVKDPIVFLRSKRIFAYWDGKNFGFRSLSPEGTIRWAAFSTTMPALTTWRGLAVQP